ncbi:hypothetical protein HSTV-3_gp123 [Halorubrum virus HSTV-3]|nr:hypothetical protein HSTV-3_gp123 [Halorubrum virus HSTV-3]
MFSPRLGTVQQTDSEKENQWSHRADLKIDQRHRAFGAIVEEKREGKLLKGEDLRKFLYGEPDPSEIHPHHEKKSEPESFEGSGLSDEEIERRKKAEKYQRRYSSYHDSE